MSRNGSGTYSLPAGNPVSGGNVISSTWANSTLSDIATALTQSIAKDGQTVPTANLPMGTFKLTGLGAGSTAGDSVRYEQVALLTAANTLTGANTFRNAAGIRSEQAATQDAIAIVGRAGGTSGYEVTITPTTLTADRTITAPDKSGTALLNTTTGLIIQRIEATPYTTWTSTATTIPYDDSIPPNTEGAEIITVSITPTSATNRLRIVFDAPVVSGNATLSAHAALFQDTTANALAACGRQINTANALVGFHIEHEMAAGTTSATTFKVRCGPNGSTLYINGSSANRLFGGVTQTRLYVEEIVV